MKFRVLSFVLSLVIVSVASASDTEAPYVVSTFPNNGSANVDPSLDVISVTFNEKMKDGNWSWVFKERKDFPEKTGEPAFSRDGKTNSLPVKLEPNKEYLIWINSPRFNNFKDKAGNPAAPYKFTFKTRAK